MNQRLRVAVLFGGRSSEHDVSIHSARSVLAALDAAGYEAAPIYVDPTGLWLGPDQTTRVLVEGAPPDADAGGSDAGSAIPATTALSPSPILAARTGRVAPPALGERLAQIDVIFPLIHGPHGEDGTVQGLCELAGLPYVGAGVLGSAVGMDKATLKDVLRQHGLPVGDSVLVQRAAWRTNPEPIRWEVADRLGFPCFVKPCNMGSSVGVSKVHVAAELAAALDLAARYDRRLLVEQFLPGREIECAVLGNDDPIASVVGEVIPDGEFYDYKAKYLDGRSQLLIPARIAHEQSERARHMAIAAFRATDAAGMARVDFFLVGHRLYVNELNTVPGFTRSSMYPKLWEASGITVPELVDRLIRLAIERHRDRMENVTR